MDAARRDVATALRVVVITDPRLAGSRGIGPVVAEALEAGARAVQLRDKEAGADHLFRSALELRDLTRRFEALLFVNDRLDVALAADADGVHLGPDDLPVAAARAHTPPGFLIGYSADDPREAARAVADGADYLGCGTVYPTTSKADAGSSIGPAGLDRLAGSVSVPVVGVGGITPAHARELARTRAAGIAVIGSVMGAADPGAAVRELLAPFKERDER